MNFKRMQILRSHWRKLSVKVRSEDKADLDMTTHNKKHIGKGADVPYMNGANINRHL